MISRGSELEPDALMASWKASEGQEEAHDVFEAVDRWSEKSSKYDPGRTEERWNHIARHPPDHIGAGTIFHLARQGGARVAQAVEF